MKHHHERKQISRTWTLRPRNAVVYHKFGSVVRNNMFRIRKTFDYSLEELEAFKSTVDTLPQGESPNRAAFCSIYHAEHSMFRELRSLVKNVDKLKSPFFDVLCLQRKTEWMPCFGSSAGTPGRTTTSSAMCATASHLGVRGDLASIRRWSQ